MSAIATTVAAIAAWRAFRVYEKMHASQETEIQRVAPNLKIAVNFQEYVSNRVSRAEYRLTLVNTGNSPIILTAFEPYTEELKRNFAIAPHNTRLEFPFELRATGTQELILFDSGTLPNLEQAKFFDANGKVWPLNLPDGFLALQKKIASQQQ